MYTYIFLVLKENYGYLVMLVRIIPVVSKYINKWLFFCEFGTCFPKYSVSDTSVNRKLNESNFTNSLVIHVILMNASSTGTPPVKGNLDFPVNCFLILLPIYTDWKLLLVHRK